MANVYTSSPRHTRRVYTSDVYTSDVSPRLLLVRFVEVAFGSLRFKLEHRSSERVLEKKETTVDCCWRKPTFLNGEFLSIATSHTHCEYTFGAFPSAIEKKSLLAQTSPALQPSSPAFCQRPIRSCLIIWFHVGKTTAGPTLLASFDKLS